MKKLIISVWAFIALPLFAQRDANIRIYPEQGNQQISKHIYGQFAEHLGSCIYGGLWVGPESDIPNTQGYRTDVLNALKKLQIPNLRWPGGCFADEYHWIPYGCLKRVEETTDPELTLAGRLLRRRISLDGWNRPQGKSPENGE